MSIRKMSIRSNDKIRNMLESRLKSLTSIENDFNREIMIAIDIESSMLDRSSYSARPYLFKQGYCTFVSNCGKGKIRQLKFKFCPTKYVNWEKKK